MKNIKLIVSTVIMFILMGCSGNIIKPKTPPNNADDRGHEMPYITTYTFTEGYLYKDYATGTDSRKRDYLGDAFVEQKDSKAQVIKFTYNKENELVGTGKLVMKPDIWYRLKIDFVNKSGKNINYQFTQDEMARSLHQFFFRTFTWEDDKINMNFMIKSQLVGEDNIFDFRYGDKFPDGSLIDPPIGFVGYFRLKKDVAKSKNIKKVVLNSILVHVMSSSKLKYDRTLKELVPYPFDNPGIYIVGVTDIDHRFEVDLNYEVK